MRDPMDELRTLSDDVSVTPLPAREVRRRGDRMRRRRTFFQAAGVAAAVAVVVSGGTMASGRLTDATQVPGQFAHRPAPAGEATPDGGWLAKVPDEFVLTDGMPEPDRETDRRFKDNVSARWVFDPCREGVRRFDAERTDLREVAQTGDGYYQRQLALYPDDATAAAALGELHADLTRCPRAQYSGASGTWQTFGSAFATGDQSFDAVQRFERGGARTLFADHYAVVRVGNAVLVAWQSGTYGSKDLAEVRRRIREPRSQVTAVVARMCIFAADPCGDRP